jgi:hypothetical protein
LLAGSHLDVVAALLAVATLTWLYRRDVRQDRAARAAIFAQCSALFDPVLIKPRHGDYPLLAGRFRGYDVKLEPVFDTMAWRKLPSLWLKVTLLARNPGSGVLDVLMRPLGTEYYSPSADLPERIPLPSGWPREAILCTSDRSTAPELDRLRPHLALFDDPKMKELVITPEGTRLVYQLDQAERPYYMVMRQVKFARPVVSPVLARALLDSVIAIHQSLAAPARQAA